ncbi:MAG: 16S rRNA (uracil(1498)-N(3))-methyltransferase [Rhodobacteraceae bacterium]|nr:16S rRNA (uracil(1498)-N(3))-methyltransferase [Paracoccaceae bacterium]
MGAARIRLYVDHPLAAGQSLPLQPDQAHYLTGVMRLADGAAVLAFDGRSGEWLCTLGLEGRRRATLTPVRQTRPQADPPDLWLLFAPLKKARTDFVVEKAVELGVRRILPVQTAFTSAERIRRERLQAQAREAAEQCGALAVPEVAGLRPLAQVLAGWDAGRDLIFCDEAMAGPSGDLPARGRPAAVLVGPEGGFEAGERARLHALPFARPLALGPRILRAETAAVAALVLWQRAAGDWA